MPFHNSNTEYLPSAHNVLNELPALAPLPAWYGVRTRSNCEKVTAQALGSKAYITYVPAYRVRRQRTDRVVEIERPLFPGYVFCRLNLTERLLPVLTTPGVVSLVSFGSMPVPIPEAEIESVQKLLAAGMGAEPYPFVREGQHIRISRGPLKGAEGILVRKRNEWRMVVSIALLQRSISVEIDREALSPASTPFVTSMSAGI